MAFSFLALLNGQVSCVSCISFVSSLSVLLVFQLNLGVNEHVLFQCSSVH